MQTVISPVSSRADRREFLRFPWRVYADDSAWVPPLLSERAEFIDPEKHPFYRHGTAALFLARRNGRVVGRIMASDDPRYNELHRANTGCFGLFECIDDAAVSHALFDAAADWLRGRGRAEIMGPIDYSTNYLCGLLIEGFEFPPKILTPHNPPYYPALVESWGLRKAKDLYAWSFTEPRELAERWKRYEERLLTRGRITIRCMRLHDLESEARSLSALYNSAWADNWGHVPLNEPEFLYMLRQLKPIAIPEGVLVAEADGQPVGFALGLPDWNEAIRHANGRLTTAGLPIGLCKLLFYKSRIKSVRFVALGVVKEYRQRSIAEVLVLRLMQECMIKRGLAAEMSQTLEDNYLVNKLIEAGGGTVYKRYRIYSKALVSPVSA